MVSPGNAWGSCKIHLLLCEGVFWGSFSTHHPLSIAARADLVAGESWGLPAHRRGRVLLSLCLSPAECVTHS